MKTNARSLQLQWLFTFLLSAFSLFAGEETKPNFILFLVDDMGWTDLGCYGSKFYETPNIDKLANQGMKFTQGYAACPVCSPTRAAILTGKYPATLHVTDYIPGEKHSFAKLKVPEWTQRLPEGEITIAQVLKSAGYATASIGKWHLGAKDARPEQFGFEFSVAGIPRGTAPSYFSPYKNPYLKDGPPGEFLPDRLTTEAVKFIEKNVNRPFFLYLPHFAVHTPIQPKPEVTAKYQKKTNSSLSHTNPAYAALVEAVDDSVGRLMAALDELKISDRTVFIFTSDNGGLTRYTSNSPLRAGKATPYEGGIRVPLIVRWPGVVKAGSTCETPAISMDFYPTFLEIAGIKGPVGQALQGESIVPLLRQEGKLQRTELYWHYPHYHKMGGTPFTAVRSGDFKLYQFHETGRFELYNVKEDVGETNNLVNTMRSKIPELNQKMDRWRKSVGAQMPLPNPAYDPIKDAEMGRAKL